MDTELLARIVWARDLADIWSNMLSDTQRQSIIDSFDFCLDPGEAAEAAICTHRPYYEDLMWEFRKHAKKHIDDLISAGEITLPSLGEEEEPEPFEME